MSLQQPMGISGGQLVHVKYFGAQKKAGLEVSLGKDEVTQKVKQPVMSPEEPTLSGQRSMSAREHKVGERVIQRLRVSRREVTDQM